MAAPWRVDADGWVEGLRRLPSPHFDARPVGSAIDLLVLHNISLPPGEFGTGRVDALFGGTLEPCGQPFLDQLVGVRVSAHFLIERSGRATQFVSCADRAWHAGESRFAGRPRCNDFSIGVELEGTDFTPFSDAQYRALDALLDALLPAYPLAHARGHSEIAPARKTDPGPFFDWTRLRRLRALRAAQA